MRPWALGALLALVTAGIVVALLTAEGSGTGAENVGESGPERAATPEPTPEPGRERERRAAALQGHREQPRRHQQLHPGRAGARRRSAAAS